MFRRMISGPRRGLIVGDVLRRILRESPPDDQWSATRADRPVAIGTDPARFAPG
jgi:hypothetical protein